MPYIADNHPPSLNIKHALDVRLLALLTLSCGRYRNTPFRVQKTPSSSCKCLRSWRNGNRSFNAVSFSFTGLLGVVMGLWEEMWAGLTYDGDEHTMIRESKLHYAIMRTKDEFIALLFALSQVSFTTTPLHILTGSRVGDISDIPQA